MVPESRITNLNERDPHADGDYVLYWMTAFRRPHYNFALDRAIEIANELDRPLLIFEPLRLKYRWCCERFHQFIMEGMEDNGATCAEGGINYLPYVERSPGEGSGLIERLAEKSAAVVTDDYPAFFLPALRRKYARRIPCRFEAVDSNGLYPMHSAPQIYSRAHFFRIFLQKNLADHLLECPAPQPFEQLENRSQVDLDELPQKWRQKPWRSPRDIVSKLDIDHEVGPIEARGGFQAGRERMERFLEQRLDDYDDRRNYPEEEATSGLSGYLHFGFVSAHELFHGIAEQESWTPDKLADKPTKKATGWWGMSDSAEAFLDQLVTWRELGFNMACRDQGYTRFDSLPAWVKKTLDEHRDDPRDPCYSLEEFEQARTDDPLWNAAQNQLRREGVIHNYLRMLWGKKILHWSESPEEALRIMVELNNKYGIDGRDPNSYSGIFWVLGRYDRAWGPERPVFGKVRYMASQNTAKKFPVKDYIAEYAS